MHQDVMQADWDAEARPPLTPTQRSWLRVESYAAFREELAPFRDALARDRRGQEIVGTWLSWLRSCSCDLASPSEECEVHHWLDDALTVYELIGKEVREKHRTDRAARFMTLPDIFEP